MDRSWRGWGACLLAGFLAGSASGAGTLSGFGSNVHSGSRGSSDFAGDCLSDPLLWEMTAEFSYVVFGYGGIASMSRATGNEIDQSEFPFIEPRTWGEALIPVARVDADYQWLQDDVEAASARSEIGFGPFGFQFKYTRFEEEEPDDSLTLNQGHFLYRMSFGAGVEVDLGIGWVDLEGESEENQLSFTAPILFHPFPGCGLEYRPAWSESLTEHSVGLIAGWKYVSATAGYRWLNGPDESLHGPYAGLSVHF